MSCSPISVANTIIDHAQLLGKPLSMVELQSTMYIAEAIAIKHPYIPAQLTNESWMVGPYGICSYTVLNKFIGVGDFKAFPINNMIPIADGYCYYISGKTAKSRAYISLLGDVLNEVVKLPSSSVVNALTSPSSLWAMAKKEGIRFVQHRRFVEDTSYEPLFPSSIVQAV